MAPKRRNIFYQNKKQETTEIHTVEDGVRAPKRVLREQEAGDDGNMYVQLAILMDTCPGIRRCRSVRFCAAKDSPKWVNRNELWKFAEQQLRKRRGNVNMVAEPKPHQTGRKRQNMAKTGNDCCPQSLRGEDDVKASKHVLPEQKAGDDGNRQFAIL
ncbi:hypothetical protein AAG570_012027 [Ranatra chinensis]|uniref:Uncharacterized protein n=1 Tax=Ranatra chinensis TaxID=642074 RepID=A0ABD0YHL4_9HEMI